QEATHPKSIITEAESADDVLYGCVEEVCTTMEQVTKIYNRTLVAVFKENRKVLREMVAHSDDLFEQARTRKYNIMITLRRMQNCDIGTGHFYVQVVDYLSEVTKALIHITRPAFEHIDNNHEGLTKAQIVDLMRVNDEVEAIFDKINEMLRTKDFAELNRVLEMRDSLFDTIVEATKSQLSRIQHDPTTSTKSGILYLTILNETKTMILQARNLLKSQNYFLENKK
ncbi:MAG: inorganic phosphate transporter, partial [Alistipes sp.]